MNKQLEELRAAALAATPGLWKWFTSNSIARLSSVQSGKDGDVMSAFTAHDGIACISVSKSNMTFIESANPAVVLALLAELEKSQQRIAELQQAMRHIHGAALDITVPREAIAKSAALSVEHAAGFKVDGDA